jgi:phosphopantothenoylcysteine decarboxylase/phosphopantothenate--cysteine ligase
MQEVGGGKISTRRGTLLAELVPTPKIIAHLRDWFPGARLIGWKFEVEGRRTNVLEAAEKQLADCRTDACVANGRAYGDGFGLVTAPGQCVHLPGMKELFAALEAFAQRGTSASRGT